MLRGAVSAAAVVISLLCASAASADYDSPSISQSDSADPVLEGATVTYTMTVTNTFGAPEHLQLDTLLLKLGSDAAVPDPYLSIESSQGSCSLTQSDSFGYRSAVCDLGVVAAGASLTVRDSVRADFSLEHLAGISTCDTSGCSLGPQSVESTRVIHPPKVSGSPKLHFSGLPEGCASADFVVKAKAAGKGVRKMTSDLKGPLSEYGSPIEGELFFRQPHAKGAKLKVKLDAGSFDPGIYRLTVTALRGSAPKLKGTVTFEVC